MDRRSIEAIFKQRIFRIPDYQRGYAWGTDQLRDFWEDLVNLSEQRSHYTGVLTLKEVPPDTIKEDFNEYWLVEDHSYQVFEVIDGQQRLTTFIILIKALIDVVKGLPGNRDKKDSEVMLTDSLSVDEIAGKFLFRTKPTGDQFRTCLFGYDEDNPSYNYFRYRVFDEPGGGAIEETSYTLNLGIALQFFTDQFQGIYEKAGLAGLQSAYKTATKRFLLNEYVITDEFDVFVAFETMNNRGKRLSDLELLKNRLIYLTTLFDNEELDPASRKSLRNTVNDAWKEIYRFLGKNKAKPLNDDEFLKAHWTMFFKYSRNTGKDYINFLLNQCFSPKRILREVERPVALNAPEEVRSEADGEDLEETESLAADATPQGRLSPLEISRYVKSLKASVSHWFSSWYPELVPNMSSDERSWITRLNRIGIGYFRPLVMAILKNEQDENRRKEMFQEIERYIFILFRVNSYHASYGSSEFYRAAREMDQGSLKAEELRSRLEVNLRYTFAPDGSFIASSFENMLRKKFSDGSGYYGWDWVRYLLFEYELSLLSASRQPKLDWNDLAKHSGDRISIEHVYPQTGTEYWADVFREIPPEYHASFSGSLGNLLILSQSINSALQNDSFPDKKCPKFDATGKKLRNGYSDGSHSEIEVAQNDDWGPEQIRLRGMKLLRFMEEHWKLRFSSDEVREALLFLDYAATK
jgi:hypothetical protein